MGKTINVSFGSFSRSVWVELSMAVLLDGSSIVSGFSGVSCNGQMYFDLVEAVLNSPLKVLVLEILLDNLVDDDDPIHTL